MRLTAREIYDRLVNDDHILKLEGQIKFYLGDVNIIVKQKDVVGNIMQEWLQGWLDARGIEHALSENTQMPPDFFLDPDDRTKGLLEVKAFNRNGSPGFDIADFRMYASEIQEKPYMLDVDYLIFGYDMNDNGVVTIKDVWLKKVWQITRRMENYPINLQVKEGVIHKIRPGVWYSERITDYAIFECLEDFISAIEETTFKEPKLRSSIASTWLAVFQKNYKAWCGKELNIPRWNDIKDKYDLVSDKKREKARERLEIVTIQKQKIEARVLKYQQDIIEAKTDKQKEKAKLGLERAMNSLEVALKKVADAQVQYNVWIKS
ncbi:MAG: NgoBV family restriction endonuclease [Lachnospiraceae bacterium]|nr:NgoBV family restriction endonuclease [Lachnospiraceae bacterium]